MTLPSNFTSKDKADEAAREVRMREHVYPPRVAAGKMRKDVADRNIAVMRAIAEDYRKLAEIEGQKGMLL